VVAGGASTQDWCYLGFLFFLVACLAVGICTLALLDRTKAYVGGIFLFLFCILVCCAFGNFFCPCCYSQQYMMPASAWWWGMPFAWPMPIYYAPAPVTIIETGHYDGHGEGTQDEMDGV
jgi:hypothetical protein